MDAGEQGQLSGVSVGSAAIVLVCAWGALAAPAPSAADEVVNALSAVAQYGDTDAAALLLEQLENPDKTAETWRKEFRQYYTTGVFTAALAQFWESAILEFDPKHRDSIALVSALCASEAVAAATPVATQLPAAFNSLVASLYWLERVNPVLGPASRSIAFDALVKGFGDNGLASYARDPARFGFYVQAGLTLRAYSEGNASAKDRLARVMALLDGARAIWYAHGILLFDNGVLTAQHIASLGTVLTAIPRELHYVYAIIVPQATGIGPGASFVTSGQIVYLPLIPMESLTSTHEFIESQTGPYAPIFTVTAAQEMVRAVQAVQFAKRPSLALRRDIILANAGNYGTRYLRHYRMLSPQTYFANPDELLPALAYVYFIDSRAVFNIAMALFVLKEEEPVDQFLLLADLLSGGTNITRLYDTSLDGAVTFAQASIGRVHGSWIAPPRAAGLHFYQQLIPADLWFCNSISYGGAHYIFEFDAQGITNRYVRR